MNILFANIVLNENTTKKTQFTIGMFYDDSKKLSIKEVINKPFIATPNQFTFGFKKGNLWFKFIIDNQSNNEDFILQFTEPYYDEMTLYRSINTTYSEEKNGLIQALNKRKIFNHIPTFNLNIQANTSQTYYIKAKSQLTTSGEFTLYKKEYFNSIHGHLDNILYMFYFGVIFTVTLLNLFIFFRLREKVYLYYSLYTFFYALWVAMYCGLILYTPIEEIYFKFMMVTPMFIMFLILFSSEFLNVKKYIPKVYLPLNIFGYTFGVLAALVIISFEPWFEVVNALASVLFLVLFSVAIYIWKKNNNINTKYYIFAMSIYMITISLMSAMTNGWIQNNDINRYSFLFGSFFEIIFFALVLTNRFYIFQNEKLILQKEILDIKTKNESILEEQIQERTQNIEKLLYEKELLLKEVFHRVKNNFHMIIGILWIKGNKYQDRTPFDELINKIKSMAKINDYLYKSENLTQIKIDDYLNDIIKLSSSISSKKVNLTVMLEDINVSFDEAMNLGIILNELLTNSIKHNQDLNEILITIKLQREANRCFLSLHDNGKHFREDKNSEGIGMMLIKEFCTKLPESQYSFSFENGTLFSLSFKSETF